MSATARYLEATQTEVDRHVFGMHDVTRALLMARIARGHALLEGPPGIGKTLLARTYASAIGGGFKRVQGTPDLTPGDITGVTVFRPDGSEFEFRAGPVFTDVLLFDELNRCNPKTQSALLEAMEERHVSVEGRSLPLPDDFVVVATQNPMDFEGTYPIPESQIDRFLVCVHLGYAGREHEARALEVHATTRVDVPAIAAVDAALLAASREEVADCRVEPALIDYVLDIAAASRQREDLALGLSTRGARALLLLARVQACAEGFDFVRADDVQAVAPWVLPHRLLLSPEAALEGLSAADIASDLVHAVAVPRLAAGRAD